MISVNLSINLVREVQTLGDEARFPPVTGGRPFDYIRSFRPHHWLKNLLVFVPLIAAHETSLELYLMVAGLFLALSACASGTYLLNDLLDRPYDRQHKTKRHRPVAAGKITPLPAMGVGVAVVLAGLSGAFLLSVTAGYFVLLYIGVALTYSLYFKRIIFIDVVVLALLFTVRVFAGALVADIPLSHWFITFFTFIFLALAIVKRQSELHGLNETNQSESGGRAYYAQDLVVMTALGAASSLAAAVVFSLYLYSPEVRESYTQPAFMWGIIPLLVYWLGRMALLANRGAINDDPVVFAMNDRASWLTCIGIAVLFMAAL